MSDTENRAVSENNYLPQVEPTLQTEQVQRPKRKSTVILKDAYVKENEQLKIKLHSLETWIKNFRQMPTMRRVILAVVNKKITSHEAL